MADPRFFEKEQSLTLGEIAALSGAELAEGADPEFEIEDVAPLHMAQSTHLSFLDNIKYKDDFLKTKAGACFASPQMAVHAPEGVVILSTKNPYKSYALAAQAFYPANTPPAQISDAASVHESAKIAQGAVIDAGAVIGENAEIAEGAWIESNAVIGKAVQIGAHTRVGPNVSITHAIVGAHCNIYPGARIGQDGFGFAIDPAGHVKVPQLGRVIIEDHVEVGANTCIDRGAGPDTVIGQGTWIDNLVQIGHNVKIGRGCVIVAHVGISGSAELGDYVVLAGQVGVAGHLKIGTGVRVAAQSGVIKDIPPGQEYFGSPAIPKREQMRQIAALKRLIKKEK